LVRVTLFPGFRERAALRQLRVPADSCHVMEWLTDPDRRQREWRRLTEAQDGVQQSSVGRLPNGGLRFDQVVLRGHQLLRHTTEDVAILADTIDRVHRAHVEFARSRTLIPLRWVMKERVTVESVGDGTGVTVRVWGRAAGLSRVLHLLWLPRHNDGAAFAGGGGPPGGLPCLWHRGSLRTAAQHGSFVAGIALLAGAWFAAGAG
jgi:hypothetical protein